MNFTFTDLYEIYVALFPNEQIAAVSVFFLLYVFVTLGLAVYLRISGITARDLTRKLVPSFLRFEEIRKSMLSPQELLKFRAKERLDEIQFLLGKENDAEKRRALEAQRNELTEQFKSSLLDNFQKEDGTIIDDWRAALILARARLLAEADRLNARASSNLTYGVLASMGAVILLFIILFLFPPSTVPNSWFEFSAVYVPRLTVIVIVQVLAAFFLRMYVANEKDIARTKNEITNIELRISAGLMAGQSKAQLNNVSSLLARDERNFVLQKGERIAHEDVESNSIKIDELLKILIDRTGTKND